MDTTIELPALRRTAELAPNSANAEARTIDVVWSTGARVRRVHATPPATAAAGGYRCS